MTAMTRGLIVYSATAWITAGATSRAADWPQWRGPHRDGHAVGERLLKTWGPGEPRRLWSVPIGPGFAGIAVSKGLLYTAFSDAKTEYAAAFDSANGALIWKVRLGLHFQDVNGDGPRSTPTVDGDRVYVLGAQGELLALDAATGAVFWRRHLVADLRGVLPQFGYASSPLIEQGLLFLPIGGSGRALVALDALNGDVAWSAFGGDAGYSSPIAVTLAGQRQIVALLGDRIVGADPRNGKLLWSWPWRVGALGDNAASPVVVPAGRLFFSSAHGGLGRLFRIGRSRSGFTPELLWESNALQNHFSTSVYWQGHLYGADGYIFKCVDASSGEGRWKVRGFGEGSAILADGHLLVLGTDGRLALVEARPDAYVEKGSLQALSGRTYAPPSLANGRLYLRSNREMAAYHVGLDEEASNLDTPNAASHRRSMTR